MKYLTDYIEDKNSALFDEMGAFFAFSNEQFDAKKQEGVTYVHIFSGLICPKGNAKALMDGLNAIYNDGVKQDMEENGAYAIIRRELDNHECYYTSDPTDAIEKLAEYPFPAEAVEYVFRGNRKEFEKLGLTWGYKNA